MLSNCQTLSHKSKVHIPINAISLTSLEAKELSENFKALSSKKDEILLFAYYLKSDSILIDRWSSKELSFTETEKTKAIEANFVISDIDDTKLVFILVELDTKLHSDDLNRIFQSNFRLLNGIQDDKTTLQLLLGDDDLLDLKVIKLKDQSAKDHYQIPFSGVHLFDEYEYILHSKFH